jgi:hypothetical protein
MKKHLSPQEKMELAYKRDHYVSAGESRHAFRKNWPKKGHVEPKASPSIRPSAPPFGKTW